MVIIPFDLLTVCPYNKTMRDWSLGLGDPLYLTIAADSRLCTPEYTNDHIWELEIGSGEPPTLSLRTTYGLRARSMRLFLRFSENGKTVSDPATFVAAPRLRRFYPNFLWLEFSPLENLNVNTEYWIPESQVAAGRITLNNQSTAMRQIRLEVCGALAPLDGQSLAPVQQQLVNVLAGQTGGLFPVVFMTGGPKPGPGAHPSLALDLELGPGATRQLTFAQAAKENLTASFEAARHTAARAWEAERARIELLDEASVFDIQTGDKDWDAAFAFSQRAALGLIFRGNQNLPRSSFVISRQPDQGFSRKGDGSDYPPAWSGQTPLESYYIASLLPGMQTLGKDVLRNFLAAQTERGEVDNRPGLGGQRSKLLAAPMLSSLAWRLYQASEDEAFLSEIFSKLQIFFWAWFSPEHDQDRNGIPEWDHLLQTGFEDSPLFDVWHPWSQGVNISTVQSPALTAMLYREANCLFRIAEKLNRTDEATLLKAQGEMLKTALESGWNARAALYAYRDRETGFSLPGKIIGRSKSSSTMIRPKAEFERPVRLLIEIQTKSPAAKRPKIEIGEFSIKGDVEVIDGHQFQWHSGGLVATSKNVYMRVGRVKASGLNEKDRVIVRTVDLTAEDHTLLLPLWAGMMDRQHAQTMIGRTVLDAERFDRPFGIPALPLLPDPQAETVGMSVHLPWNQLIGEGLLAYGFRTEASRLTAHLMNAVIQSLKQTHAFYQRYHAERGAGIGERNALNGFAPLGLFLQALGVTVISPTRVRLEGKNLFPWPVTIKYKGLIVERGPESTMITFPNGETTTITDSNPTIVSA